MARRTIRTPKNRDAILDQLRSGSAIATSCARVPIGLRSYYDWRSDDPDFAAACDDAIEYGTDVLEDVARTRAVIESDTLLIFLLKARRPAKYRETQVHIHGSKPGEPIRHKHEHEVTVYDHSTLTPEQQFNLDQLLADVQSGKVTS